MTQYEVSNGTFDFIPFESASWVETLKTFVNINFPVPVLDNNCWVGIQNMFVIIFVFSFSSPYARLSRNRFQNSTYSQKFAR